MQKTLDGEIDHQPACGKRGNRSVLAAERGGNCALTRPGETVEAGDVKVMGPLNLPSTAPYPTRFSSRSKEALRGLAP